MPDIQNKVITVLGNANVNVPRATISARVVESNPPYAVLNDFTGGNALNWPGVISTLTAAQRQELIDMLSTWLIMTKAGLT